MVVADSGRRWSSGDRRDRRCRHRGSYRVINNDRKFCSTDTAGGAWSRSRSWNDQQNWPELPLIAALTRTREHRVLRPDLLERPGRCSGGLHDVAGSLFSEHGGGGFWGDDGAPRAIGATADAGTGEATGSSTTIGNSAALTQQGALGLARAAGTISRIGPSYPLIGPPPALTRTREHRVLRPDLLERPGRCSGG